MADLGDLLSTANFDTDAAQAAMKNGAAPSASSDSAPSLQTQAPPSYSYMPDNIADGLTPETRSFIDKQEQGLWAANQKAKVAEAEAFEALNKGTMNSAEFERRMNSIISETDSANDLSSASQQSLREQEGEAALAVESSRRIAEKKGQEPLPVNMTAVDFTTEVMGLFPQPSSISQYEMTYGGDAGTLKYQVNVNEKFSKSLTPGERDFIMAHEYAHEEMIRGGDSTRGANVESKADGIAIKTTCDIESAVSALSRLVSDDEHLNAGERIRNVRNVYDTYCSPLPTPGQTGGSVRSRDD